MPSHEQNSSVVGLSTKTFELHCSMTLELTRPEWDLNLYCGRNGNHYDTNEANDTVYELLAKPVTSSTSSSISLGSTKRTVWSVITISHLWWNTYPYVPRYILVTNTEMDKEVLVIFYMKHRCEWVVVAAQLSERVPTIDWELWELHFIYQPFAIGTSISWVDSTDSNKPYNKPLNQCLIRIIFNKYGLV